MVLSVFLFLMALQVLLVFDGSTGSTGYDGSITGSDGSSKFW